MSRMVFVRFLTLAALMAGLIALVGYTLEGRDSASAGQAAMAGCLIAYLGSVAGVLPVLASREQPNHERLPVIFLAMAVRLGAFVVLALAAVVLGRLPARPLLLWAVLSHVALLVPDSLLSIRLVAR